ncbi:hypothetical protein CCMA1212_000601 [Trichoderma ghanense]|uniref:Uncharacterized protein n=1 Tax=Trichoderma ghanense TaxID=65468 RepID=A0ABY2HET0_9HYPO
MEYYNSRKKKTSGCAAMYNVEITALLCLELNPFGKLIPIFGPFSGPQPYVDRNAAQHEQRVVTQHLPPSSYALGVAIVCCRKSVCASQSTSKSEAEKKPPVLPHGNMALLALSIDVIAADGKMQSRCIWKADAALQRCHFTPCLTIEG